MVKISNRERNEMPIVLKYDGAAIQDTSEMDAYDVARSIMAFSDFLVIASHMQYGEDIDVNAKVRPFKQGSFVTQLIYQLSAGLCPSLISTNIGLPECFDLLKLLIKQTINLINFKKGEPLNSLKKIKNSPNSTIYENCNGNTFNVTNINVSLLVQNPLARKSIETFIAKPLEKEGIDCVSLLSESGGDELVSICKNDADNFSLSDIEKIAETKEFRLHLLVGFPNISTNPKNKWTLIRDGVQEKYSMNDIGFLQKIENHDQGFFHGDVLDCTVLVTYKNSDLSLKIKDRIITKVHKVIRGNKQIAL